MNMFHPLLVLLAIVAQLVVTSKSMARVVDFDVYISQEFSSSDGGRYLIPNLPPPGLSGLVPFSWYGNTISQETFSPPERYDEFFAGLATTGYGYMNLWPELTHTWNREFSSMDTEMILAFPAAKHSQDYGDDADGDISEFHDDQTGLGAYQFKSSPLARPYSYHGLHSNHDFINHGTTTAARSQFQARHENFNVDLNGLVFNQMNRTPELSRLGYSISSDDHDGDEKPQASGGESFPHAYGTPYEIGGEGSLHGQKSTYDANEERERQALRRKAQEAAVPSWIDTMFVNFFSPLLSVSKDIHRAVADILSSL